MVNDTSAICANIYIKEGNRYSMSNTNNAQNRGVALNMANENRVINSIMSSGTGDAVMSDVTSRTKEYKHLIDYGLDAKVANRLDEIFKTEKLLHSDLDDRALDALKEFPADGALAVLAQFLESNLEHVSNKSAYLCGVMKTYRQKSRSGISLDIKSSNVNGNAIGPSVGGQAVKGPDEEKIKEILERTGYTLDVTTGQRKFGGPPPGWEGEPPSNGCEVFCGKIPRDIYESDLIPLFEKCGKIWDLRLMMDPMTGLNRGYAFVTFTSRDAAQEAVRQLDSYEIGEGKILKVNVSEPKTRLFIGNIPKSKGKEEIDEEFRKLSAGLREVIIYSSPDDKKKNRGFCFLEYESHKAASLAKRRLETGRVKVWSCDIIVDWADPQEEPDDDTMSQVKVLYVRNLTSSVSEDKLREVFEAYGKIDRVKKIKDYAFVHFDDREHAGQAMAALNHQELNGSPLEISLAKPPSDKKKKEEMLRKREQRMMRAMSHGLTLPPFPPFPGAAYGASLLGNIMYRGGNLAQIPHNRAAGNGMQRISGGGGMARGFDNSWQWAGWPETWDYSQNRGGPLVPWFGANNWGHQFGNTRGNASSNTYSQAYGNSWGTGNGVIPGGALHGYNGSASVGTSSSHRTGGNRKGYSQR